jgi:2-oxoisovalerate dehydrogenase E1 component
VDTAFPSPTATLGGISSGAATSATHLNQYFANAGSPTQAREGNIHHGDPAKTLLPMISHLGAMLSTVAGGADSQRRQGTPPSVSPSSATAVEHG